MYSNYWTHKEAVFFQHKYNLYLFKEDFKILNKKSACQGNLLRQIRVWCTTKDKKKTNVLHNPAGKLCPGLDFYSKTFYPHLFILLSDYHKITSWLSGAPYSEREGMCGHLEGWGYDFWPMTMSRSERHCRCGCLRVSGPLLTPWLRYSSILED